MGRKEKPKAKKTEHEDEDEAANPSTPLIFEASSDDEEANEDLSLKIVEKALLMRKLAQKDVVSGGDGVGASSSQQDEVVVARYDGVLDRTRGVVDVSDSEEQKSERKKKSRSKKKKVKKVESEDQSVSIFPCLDCFIERIIVQQKKFVILCFFVVFTEK